MIELFNIDCMKYMPTLPDKAFDLAIVDPPYYDGPPNKRGYYGPKVSSSGVLRKEYKVIERWEVPEKAYFTELLRISKNQIIWGINYYNIENLGPGRIIWDKCNGSTSYSDCEIAYNSSHKAVRMIRYMWNGFMQGKNLQEGHILQGNHKLKETRIHPTQKPIALYRWLLQKYAKKGQRVIDTHLGSGSSAVAAHYFGCDFVGCEMDLFYFQAATERIKLNTRQTTLF